MIKFQEVIDFIEKNKNIFDIFSQEVSNATRVNESILQDSNVDKIYMKRAYRKIKADLFKKDSYRAAPREIFLDLLLNGYNTIAAGNEFQLTKKDHEDDFDKLSLTTKHEKLSYLASLYIMLFDYDYASSFYERKLEEYLAENDMLLFKLEIKNMANVLNQEIEMNDNGRLKGGIDYIDEIYMIKQNSYLTGSQLANHYEYTRLKIDKLEGNGTDEKTYEEVKQGLDYRKVFPQTLAQKIEEVIKKPPVPKILSNITNEFAIKALMNSLPNKLDEAIYKNFKNGVMKDRQNLKLLTREETEFLAAKILVDKYSYKEVQNIPTMYWGAPKKLIDIDITSNRKYEKMYEVSSDVIKEYIKKYNGYNIRSINNLMNFMFLMVVLYKQKEDLLKVVIKETKEDFEAMLKQITPDTKSLMKKYNVKDIKNKKLFKEMLPHLNRYFFEQNAHTYRAYTQEIRELMCNNYLNTMVLEQTVYSRQNGIQALGAEPKRDQEMEPIIKIVAEVFEFERK